MHKKDEIIVYKKIESGEYTYCLEEYWEEDDAGYCVSDFVLAKHTRLSVYDKSGARIKVYDLDSREYDKDMWQDGGTLYVRWHPAFDREEITQIKI
ncbi:MAG: hypothetical protein IJJ25_05880 [Lachnospiraceae bacterium]|nr:hypothetical protein [Lachnospiraceae bacterium]